MFQTFNDWEMERCGKFTASEIYKLISKPRTGNGYFSKEGQTYIRAKAAEILTMELVNGGRSNMPAMEWGNANEYDAVERFKKETGLEVEYFGGANPKFFEYSPFSGGSPDGVGEDFIIESKCPFNAGEHLSHLLLNDFIDLKDYYPEAYWQMTFNMIVTQKEFGYFISFDPRYADEKLQIKIIKFELVLGDKEILLDRLAESEKQLAELITNARKIV